jgi:IS605 OrfB family transposase
MIITRKIEIGVDRSDEEKYKEAWNFINYHDNNIYKAANDIVSHQYFNYELRNRLKLGIPQYKVLKKELDKIVEQELETTDKEKKKGLSDSKKRIYGEMKPLDEEINEKFKEILNTSVQNSTYQVISDRYPHIHSNIRNTLNATIQKTYKAAFIDLIQGKRSLPTYKKGIPIPFQFTSDFSIDDNGEYLFEWLHKIKFKMRFGRDRSNNKSIVDRIIGGEYKRSDSSIQLKNNKLFLLLVVDIGEVDNALDKNICVGLDTGLNIPVYLALNNGHFRQSVGSREEFLNIRLRLQAKRRQLQRSLKDNQGGKGRTKKLSALENAAEKERNFIHTQNHIFSKAAITFALKNNAGVIKMERLEGIGEDLENKFLTRNWSYFELQKLVEYKAKYHNIEVQYVNPRNTSKTCSFCGNLEDGQRMSQKDFQCKNPDCSNQDDKGANMIINADYNAARNIAASENYVK